MVGFGGGSGGGKTYGRGPSTQAGDPVGGPSGGGPRGRNPEGGGTQRGGELREGPRKRTQWVNSGSEPKGRGDLRGRTEEGNSGAGT